MSDEDMVIITVLLLFPSFACIAFHTEILSHQLCNKVGDGWTDVLMKESRVPYKYVTGTANGIPDQLLWISYDNVQSFTEKVSKRINNNNNNK